MGAEATLFPELPRSLQVEVTGACNLSCHMCLVRYRPKLSRREGALSMDAFRALLDSLPGLERLTLQGLGEPLLAPDLLEMVEEAKRRGVKVGFNSNASLLSGQVSARLVELSLDWLHVSLDGASAGTYESIRDGANFETVRKNLEGLLAARRRAGATLPAVELVFVAMRRNVAELPELVRLARELGVDGVFVQNLSHSFSDTDPAGRYQEIRRFAAAEALWTDGNGAAETAFEEAREQASALGVKLRLPRLEDQRPRAPGEPGCDWPWRSAYVDHRARVQPCCMVMGAERATLGELDEQGLTPVWDNGAYREFRRRLLSEDDPPEVCRGCSLYRGVF
jgi:radical SAM protein with 4Fe4S-binding SPASM domain